MLNESGIVIGRYLGNLLAFSLEFAILCVIPTSPKRPSNGGNDNKRMISNKSSYKSHMNIASFYVFFVNDILQGPMLLVYCYKSH